MRPIYIFKRKYKETQDMDDLEVMDTIYLGYHIMHDKIEATDDFTKVREKYIFPINQNTATYLSELRKFPTTWYTNDWIANEKERISLAVMLYNNFVGENGDINKIIKILKNKK